MALEIERKYLAKVVGPLPFVKVVEVTQGYLVVSYHAEVRIRETWWRYPEAKHYYRLAVKLGVGLVRREYEWAIPEWAYRALAAVTRRWVQKTRGVTPTGWEVDRFHGHYEGLVLAEIELDTADAALPEHPSGLVLVHDVTDLTHFANKTLATVREVDRRLYKDLAYRTYRSA